MKRLQTKTHKCEVTQITAAQVAVGKAFMTPAEMAAAGPGAHKRVNVVKLEELGQNVEAQIIIEPDHCPRVGDVYDLTVTFVRGVED